MASSLTIAREFHRLALAEDRPITPLELIKLTYIAHGWSLARRDKPLVGEPAEAWRYGPVFPMLYHCIKGYGGKPVKKILDYEPDEPIRLTEDEKKLIQAVYQTYKKFRGIELSALTHQPDSPWDKVITSQGRDGEIDDALIKAHYKGLDKKNQDKKPSDHMDA